MRDATLSVVVKQGDSKSAWLCIRSTTLYSRHPYAENAQNMSIPCLVGGSDG